MTSVSGASLAPDFPRDLRSSPYVSAAADSFASGFLHSAGPLVSFDSCPGTSGASDSASEVPLMLTTSEKDDKDSPSLDKGEFSKSF